MNKEIAVRRRSSADQRLSPDDVVRVLELLKGSNTVELKLVVPDTHRGTVKQLGFDPVEAEPRQIFFFDTPDLTLNKAGVFVRARRSPRGRGDTVVKLRPIDPQTIDAELRKDESFKIEVDVMPGGYVCSASFKGRCSAQDVLNVNDGNVPLSSILSQNQRDFYVAHAPANLSMDELVPLGPTFILRMKNQPKGFDRRIIVELWLYPDGTRMLELSTKGMPEEAFQLAAVFRAFAAKCGIPLARQSVTKTSSALAYFSKHRDAQSPQ